MPTSRAAVRLLPLLLLVLAAACHRTAATALPGADTWAVRVENQTARAMVVSFEDARGTGVLGTVRAGSSTRFILDDVHGTEISVSGRSDDGSLTSGPHAVRLSAGSTARVTLR